MDVLKFKDVTPNKSFPWFEEYSQHNFSCKVYHDGSGYVAVPVSNGPRKKKVISRPILYDIDYLFDELYLKAMRENVRKEHLSEFIKNGLLEVYPEEFGLDSFVEQSIKRKQKNLFQRKKRCRRKAFLNEWNYFVTFTYDSEKHTEESFRMKLRKCLSNLHSRRGWKYFGVPEYSPEEKRLHFHLVMYIPEGEMVGKIYERRDYSTKNHKMQVSHPNDYFERRFGRCDFTEISTTDLKRGTALNYILKYLEKSGERIIYSRGIPSDFIKEVSDEDIICEMIDFVAKYVLFDDCIDYEVDVLKIKRAPDIVLNVPLTS